jgi:Arc/MetJ family transcription regulator
MRHASPQLTPGVSKMDIGTAFMPYFFCMKMTMHIDEALLKRVMTATGVSSKTKAVDLALRELDRRAELIRLAREGLGLTAEELKHAYNPASDPDTTLRCAEARRVYGRKSRSR